MDFVSDQLYDGKRFRVLTLIDLFTRECLATYADKAIKGEGVCAILQHVSKLTNSQFGTTLGGRVICGFSVSTSHVPVSVAILADCSDSMGSTATATEEAVNELYQRLNQSQQCQIYAFSSDTVTVDGNDSG